MTTKASSGSTSLHSRLTHVDVMLGKKWQNEINSIYISKFLMDFKSILQNGNIVFLASVMFVIVALINNRILFVYTQHTCL